MQRFILTTALFIGVFSGCSQLRRQLSGGYYLERFDEGGTSY